MFFIYLFLFYFIYFIIFFVYFIFFYFFFLYFFVTGNIFAIVKIQSWERGRVARKIIRELRQHQIVESQTDGIQIRPNIFLTNNKSFLVFLLLLLKLLVMY